MLTATIKIELNALEKAKVEVEALLVYIDELAKTYPTTFKDAPKEEVKKEAPKKEAPKKEAPKKEEEVKEATSEVTLEALTDKARTLAKTKREEVKDAIASFGAGKLSSVPVDKYDELYAKLEELS
jgi:pyruvate/2-oxoglutarate dehydrogenase complex dihydrolipoamide acyltransferase (E2) component